MNVPADIMFLLPEPPSSNSLFREVNLGGRARRVRTMAYNRWRVQAVQSVAAQAPPERIEGGYSLRITVPKQRGRDLGNNEKPISDLLQHAGIVKNDVACTRIVIDRDMSREPGSLLVEIWAA